MTFKTGRYKSTYMNPMATTNQKPPRDIQKLKRKVPKHTTKENHHTITGSSNIHVMQYKF